MFHRIIKPLKSNSFFIFGARGTGKSTFILKQFGETIHYINLLEEKFYLRYSHNADLLIKDLEQINIKNRWVVIDEVQKIPQILNTVHHLIEKKKIKFVLTGSSARKLKRNSANLLAGRAFSYNLFPLTVVEIGDQFSLDFVLNWGSIPKIFSLDEEGRQEFLKGYAQTYLKEEILQEQIVRNGFAFRNFLEIAAQQNGKLINYSKIAKDVGVDTKTIQNYFQILEDTLVGFYLPAYHKSIRKSVGLQPKFYLFDLGIKKALERSLHTNLNPRTPAYGEAFEHFIICEILRLNSYARTDFGLSQYHTTAGGEVDLIMHRGKEVIAVEIKSSLVIDEAEVRKLNEIAKGIRSTQVVYLSQDPNYLEINNVKCMHWRDFLTKQFSFK